MDDLRNLLATSIVEEIKEFLSEDLLENLPENIQDFMDNEFIKVTQEVMKFRSSLTDETDRGCALISASFLDYQLEKLIRSYLVDDKSVSDNIFSHSGALGTFSARIDSAYLLGLIGKKMHRDLHIIRKIRNEFGHNPEPISFETQSIKNRCEELYYYTTTYDVSSRKYFIGTVCGVLGQIKGKMVNVKHINPECDWELTEEVKKINTQMGEIALKNIFDKASEDID